MDGYVYLDDNNKSGLGHYLYESLNQKIPIIGVAKTAFHGNHSSDVVCEVARGKSTKPLYVTSVGIPVKTASEYIKQMHGEYRFPTLLGLLDQHTKMEK